MCVEIDYKNIAEGSVPTLHQPGDSGLLKQGVRFVASC